MDHQRGIPAVIDDQPRALSHLQMIVQEGTCPVFFKRFPFQANTGTPALAIAAAAWSCVEKILQDAHRTSAPSDLSVSIKNAVSMVM